MVVQHARWFSDASFPGLDVTRIAAGAGAIALNVIVLLMLLVPAGMPDLDAQPARRDLVVVPVFEKILPPQPPIPVPVAPPTTPVAPTTPVPVEMDVPPALEQVVVDQGALPAAVTTPAPAATGMADVAPPAGPVAGVRLEYAKAPPPPYPGSALRAGLQGTVMLQVLVDVDGRPLDVEVKQSSGYRVLDAAARRHLLRNWTFRPAMVDGRPVQAVGIVPIAYSLD